MTYYFGFATNKKMYVAADRRRIHIAPEAKTCDQFPKVIAFSKTTALLGAGFLHFFDEFLAKQAARVFGTEPIDLEGFSASLDRHGASLAEGHRILTDLVAEQQGSLELELGSTFSMAGVARSGEPFSISWDSNGGFQPLRTGSHLFALPRCDEENAELIPMIAKLRAGAEGGASWRETVSGVAEVIARVASFDESVSPNGDVDCLGGWRQRRAAF